MQYEHFYKKMSDNALKCVSCFSILESPVILPCAHSVCGKHVDEHPKEVIHCNTCEDHDIPDSGFIPNLFAQEFLDHLREEHTATVTSCRNLEDLISKFDLLKADPSNEIHEAIGELPVKIDLKKDEIILENENEEPRIIAMLDESKDIFMDSEFDTDIGDGWDTFISREALDHSTLRQLITLMMKS